MYGLHLINASAMAHGAGNKFLTSTRLTADRVEQLIEWEGD